MPWCRCQEIKIQCQCLLIISVVSKVFLKTTLTVTADSSSNEFYLGFAVLISPPYWSHFGDWRNIFRQISDTEPCQADTGPPGGRIEDLDPGVITIVMGDHPPPGPGIRTGLVTISPLPSAPHPRPPPCQCLMSPLLIIRGLVMARSFHSVLQDLHDQEEEVVEEVSTSVLLVPVIEDHLRVNIPHVTDRDHHQDDLLLVLQLIVPLDVLRLPL